jgi:hypothetical protein
MTDHVPYTDGNLGRIPLFDQYGQLRGWTLVDADVLDWASQWRWHLTPEGYAVRQVGPRLVNGKDGRTKLPLHRAILGLPPTGEPRIRFINGIPLDARKSNLEVSPAWVVKQLRRHPEIGRALIGFGGTMQKKAA